MALASSSRRGQLWTDGDYEELVDGLRNGVILEDIAEALGRTLRALPSQVRRLMPAETAAEMGERDRELWLRYELAVNPAYNWRAWLREAFANEGRWYVDAQDEQVLAEGWHVRQPLVELCSQLNASELDIAKYLVAMGLASDIGEVADRLGVIPGGTLDIRLKMAADRAAAACWELIVDDFDGILRSMRHVYRDRSTWRRHISSHARYDDAVNEFDRLLIKHQVEGGDELGAVFWSIAERTAGERTAGAEYHGTYPELHPGGVSR